MNDRKSPTTYHSISGADARDGRGDGVFAVGYLISLLHPQFLYFMYYLEGADQGKCTVGGRKDERR